MASIYFPSSFGDVPLLIASIDTDRGRDVVIQSPSSGDEHPLNDRGRRAVIANCELLFVDQPGLDDYLKRYDQFLALAESGESQVFTHPLDGAYLARAENVSVSAETKTAVAVSCTFIRETPSQQVFPVGAGVSAQAGVEGVTVAATTTDAALASAGLSSSAPAACRDAVTAWSEADELDSAQVFLTAGALAARIDAEIDRLDLLSDLSLWPSFRQLVELRYQVVRAAEVFTSDVETLVDVYVATPRPLRAICVEVYGAADVEDRAEQVRKLNRIRTPARVPTGTYKFPRAA